jgi:hypothetical protein
MKHKTHTKEDFMNTVSNLRIRTIARPIQARYLLCLSLALQGLFSPRANADEKPKPSTVQVSLSEWKVSLTPSAVLPGPVVLEVTNSGDVPHALEIEGRGIEKSTAQIMPGASATLTLDLRAGTYEAYCPVGKGSHKMLGMINQLSVGDSKRESAESHVVDSKGKKLQKADADEHGEPDHGAMHDDGHGQEADGGSGAKTMKVVGGGPVIQILPGPFPFADNALAVIQTRPADQQADLTKKAHTGPYSNNVAKIAGNISLEAVDRGASGDHTPLVPTIQSSVALWAFAHLYKNDELVTNNAMVHVMLLSRTRRTSDWALDCWDCSDRPIEELQLQVTSAPNTPAFDAPGGFLFVNWEKSSGKAS